MRRKPRLGEAAFVIGTVVLSFATSLMAKAGFGMSVGVSPAYVMAAMLGVTPGTMSYLFQGALVMLTFVLVRGFRPSFLFSFVAAVLFGLMVDFFSEICLAGVVLTLMRQRIAFYVAGLLLNSLAVAFLLHSYFPPQAPELFVKNLAPVIKKSVYRTKHIFDICMFTLSLGLSLLAFHEIRFIGVGTLIAAAINGPLIGVYGRAMDRYLDFSPCFPRIASFFVHEREREEKK